MFVVNPARGRRGCGRRRGRRRGGGLRRSRRRRSRGSGCRISRRGDDSTPPFAVPSSLVMTMPVTPIMSRKVSAWACAFWPTVASSTSSTACGASGRPSSGTRTIFCSSPIRSALLCSRPAVSISRMSAPLLARLDQRVVGEAGGVGAGRAGQHRAARRARPRSATARRRRRGTCRRRRGSRFCRRRGIAWRACRSSSSCRCR